MTTYEIEIVAIPEQALVCLRGRGPLTEISQRAQRLSAVLAAAGLSPTGPLQARFYDEIVDRRDADFEVCLPIAVDENGWVPDSIGEATVTLTPAHHVMATTQHGHGRGPFEDSGDARQAIRDELAAVGYAISGPASETYVSGLPEETAAADCLTVVSYPYAR